MRFQTLGNKANFVSVVVRNVESSASIPAGAPVVLAANGTEDGLSVHLPTSSTSTKIGPFARGIAATAIAAGKLGEIYINGVYGSAIILHMTRAASTDAWASYVGGATGAVLGMVTVANGLSVLAASTASIAHGIFLMESFASATTVASTTAVTGLSSTSARKVFLRMM